MKGSIYVFWSGIVTFMYHYGTYDAHRVLSSNKKGALGL